MSEKKRSHDSLSTSSRYDRLGELGRKSYVSKSGIARLLQTVKDESIPEAFSRSTQYRARKETVERTTQYGKLVTTIPLKLLDGSEVNLGIQNPLAMIAYAAKNSEEFACVLRSTHAATPPLATRPWKIVLYQDGVDPSDGLAKCHSRKT